MEAESGKKKQNKIGSNLLTSLLLLLVALAAISAVTYAWFTLSDNTRLNTLRMDVTTGLSLRFDLDPHTEFTDYKQTLTFEEIADRILLEQGFDMREVPLDPVTSSDGKNFFLENGTGVLPTSGKYLEFTLHFMAMSDMYVHIVDFGSAAGENNGTLIWSNSEPQLGQAMRMSFTWQEGDHIYSYRNGINYNEFNYDNSLFFLPADTDKPVLVRIWLEGNDPLCTNDLKGADYSIRMRFEGTDENNQPLQDSRAQRRN